MDDKTMNNIIDQLSTSISDDVGNMHENDLESISNEFNKTLSLALKSFNSEVFDDDGFIKKMMDLQLDGDKDHETVRNVLNDLKSDYVNVESMNHSELLLKRDLNNITMQMPEMRDVVYVIRDSIIECDIATGEVSRTLLFENHENDETLQSQVKDIEEKHNILMAIKNYIVPNTLNSGEMYIHIVPYAKLFAEIEKIKDSRFVNRSNVFKESIPNTVKNSFCNSVSLYSEENIAVLMESVSPISKVDDATICKINGHSKKADVMKEDGIAKSHLTTLLNSIDVYNGSSEILAEVGPEEFSRFVHYE